MRDSEKADLPIGWVGCRLPDFTDIIMGQSPPSETYNKGKNGLPFFQGKAEFGPIHPTVVKYCDTPNKIARKGATLLSVRAPVGPTNLALVECCVGRGLAAIHPLDDILPKFVFYLLRCLEPNISKEGTGSTFSAINKQFLEDLQIPLPPLPEQHRIVTKIEELFSELDKGIESFKTAREQLKVYRQALLKHAFEGKLTEKWREEHVGAIPTGRPDVDCSENHGRAVGVAPTKHRKPLPPLTAAELAELPELPDGWGWVSIDHILSLIKKPMTTGPFGTLLNKGEHKTSGVPVLGIENIGNGTFVAGNKIFVSEDKAKDLETYTVCAGDIIISRSGTVGEICKVPDRLGHALISTNLIRVSLNNSVIVEDYFVYLFQGGSVKTQVKELCKGSSRVFLNQTILSSLSFPLPSHEEQQEMVSILDSHFSALDNLDQTITTALQQAEALRQSILKKAFSGQLVPQDPDDEPAAALLARIKAERAVVGAIPTGRPNSRTKNQGDPPGSPLRKPIKSRAKATS